jgi:hypothetical protein
LLGAAPLCYARKVNTCTSFNRRAGGALSAAVLAAGLLACSSSTGGAVGTGGTGGATSTSGTSHGATSATSTTSTSGTSGTGGAAGTGGSTGGDTWTNYADGFFKKYCVECHSPTVDPMYDFTQYVIVKKDSAIIRCGVAATQQSGCGVSPPPKQFPISDMAGTNPKPSDAERDRIVAWIEAGLPE